MYNFDSNFEFEMIVVFYYGDVIHINRCITVVAVDAWTICYIILGGFMVSNSDWF